MFGIIRALWLLSIGLLWIMTFGLAAAGVTPLAAITYVLLIFFSRQYECRYPSATEIDFYIYPRYNRRSK